MMQQTPGRKRGACTGAGLLSGLVTLRLSTLKQPVPEGLHIVIWTHTGVHEVVHGNNSCWRSLWRTAFYGTDLTLEQRKSVRSPPSEEKGVTEICDKDQSPHPLSPCAAVGKKRESGVKLSLGRRE